MDTDLRASLFTAGAAALLSALVGLFSGVGVLAIIIRALAGGLIFGALAYVCILAARKFLPGLGSGEAVGEAEAGGIGRTIDIVLPGEPPAAGERGAAQGGAQGGAQGATQGAAPFERRSDRDDVLDGGSLLDSEPIVSVPTIAVPIDQEPAARGVAAVGDELDLLPDLDGFTDSFAAEYTPSHSSSGSGSSSGPGAAQPSGRAPSGSRGATVGGMDPATMAQAVRTILKRDQKG